MAIFEFLKLVPKAALVFLPLTLALLIFASFKLFGKKEEEAEPASPLPIPTTSTEESQAPAKKGLRENFFLIFTTLLLLLSLPLALVVVKQKQDIRNKAQEEDCVSNPSLHEGRCLISPGETCQWDIGCWCTTGVCAGDSCTYGVAKQKKFDACPNQNCGPGEFKGKTCQEHDSVCFNEQCGKKDNQPCPSGYICYTGVSSCPAGTTPPGQVEDQDCILDGVNGRCCYRPGEGGDPNPTPTPTSPPDEVTPTPTPEELTPTPTAPPDEITPTPTPVASQCQRIKIYDQSWIEISYEALSQLLPGTTVRITVKGEESGTFDKGRIRINSMAWTSENETTNQKPDSPGEFYLECLIGETQGKATLCGTGATEDDQFKIEAEVHDVIQDEWR